MIKSKKRVSEFGEVFTPTHVADMMCSMISDWGGSSCFFEPCCGNGQILSVMLSKRYNALRGSDKALEIAISSIFGMDIQRDNVFESRERLFRECLSLEPVSLQRALNLHLIIRNNIEHVTDSLNRINRKALKFRIGEDMMSQGDFLQSRRVQKEIISRFTDMIPLENNWQVVKTPDEVVTRMTAMLDPSDFDFAFIVLFNLELLEALKNEYHVPSGNILFVGDCEEETLLARKMFKVDTMVFSKKDSFAAKFDEIKTYKISKPSFDRVNVVMNPPYQKENGKSSASPIYHLFLSSIIDKICPDNLISIHPCRWMQGGKGLSDFRERMIQDKRIITIRNFFDCKLDGENIFPNVVIEGGVQILHWKKDYSGTCNMDDSEQQIGEFDIVIKDERAKSIISKIQKDNSYYVESFVSGQTPFGINTNYVPLDNGVPCFFSKVASRNHNGLPAFVAQEHINDKNNIMHLWKVVAPEADGGLKKREFAFHKDYPAILHPNHICSQSYLVVYSSNNFFECENFVTYFKTKFFRFMLSQRITSQHVSKSTYSFVPDLEDYSKPWTDAELYERFNLSAEEIELIETTIGVM